MPKKSESESESESDSTIENDGAILYGYQFFYSGLGHQALKKEVNKLEIFQEKKSE